MVKENGNFLPYRISSSFLCLTISIAAVFLFILSFFSNSALPCSPNPDILDPNTEPDLAGYKVFYGPTSQGYGTAINVGNVTSYTVTGLTAGKTYFLAVRAYDTSNNESGFSNEVSGLATEPNQSASYTITTNYPGIQYVVDGTTYSNSQTFNWVAGSSHTLSLVSPQAGARGVRYVFGAWSDGGAQTHTITAPSTNTTFTANFVTQYSLTTVVSPIGAGAVNPSGTNWYNSGQSISIKATAPSGSRFIGWSGDLSGTTSPASVGMTGPRASAPILPFRVRCGYALEWFKCLRERGRSL